jgi:probable HAF family extracellular repeat protein
MSNANTGLRADNSKAGMHTLPLFNLSIGAAILLTAFYVHAEEPAIDLGTLPGGRDAYAYGISADGTIVVGYGTSASGTRAFKYTASGIVDLGTLPGGIRSNAHAISADGSTVVGNSNTANGDHAFKYTANGMVDLGTLPGGRNSLAQAVSADGATVVGWSETASGYPHAFKHTANGMVDLGTLGGLRSYAYGVSADGAIVAGWSNTASGNRAFKHTANGMVSLGTLPGGRNSYAQGISADGTTVVGYGDTASGEHAFKHTANGMVDLGTLPGGNRSYAYAVSADGSIVVGMSNTVSGVAVFRAVKYTDSGGMVDLGTLGGNDSSARAVSADGRVIAGYARTANGDWHVALWKSKATGDSTIVDADNTRTALAQTAQQAMQVLDMRSAQLQMLMQQDCLAGVGDGRFCIGAGAAYSGSSHARSTAASFTLGYQVTPQWRVGATINQSLDNSLPSEYKSSNNLPGIGIFSTFNARKDGLGWQARVAAAFQKSKLDINRKQLPHTEGGVGRADLDGKAAAVEGSYRMLANNGVLVAPYAALRCSSVNRSAYNESNDLAFVGRYAEMGRSATSVDAGLRVGKAMSDKFSLSADVGLVRDISVNNRSFAVAMDYVGGFNLGNGDDKRTRAHLDLQGNYALANDSAIQGGLYWAQQAYGNSSTSAQIRLIRQF